MTAPLQELCSAPSSLFPQQPDFCLHMFIACYVCWPVFCSTTVDLLPCSGVWKGFPLHHSETQRAHMAERLAQSVQDPFIIIPGTRLSCCFSHRPGGSCPKVSALTACSASLPHPTLCSDVNLPREAFPSHSCLASYFIVYGLHILLILLLNASWYIKLY